MKSKDEKNVKILIIIIILITLTILAIILANNTKKIEISKEKNVTKEFENKNEIKNIIETNKIEANQIVTNQIPETTNEDNSNSQIIQNEEKVKFDNTVAFIGDSRTQGFISYTGLKDVIDYSSVGLMVDTAMSKKFVKATKGNKITILEDMKDRKINRVYIMLGINELGWAHSEVFVQKYKELIEGIKNVKPTCEIYIQSIIPVTKEKSESDKTYNNRNIREYNKLIKKITEEENVKYLDVATALSDKDGNLPEEASTEGIHINKEYSLKWLEYIEKNS